MKRKTISKSLAANRRRKRLRKLKAAALSLGLATAWCGSGEAATLFSTNATLTITASQGLTFFGHNSTITITVPPKKEKSVGASIGPIHPPASGGGGSTFLTSLSDVDVDDPTDFVPINNEKIGSFFVGIDAGGDLVLSVPNGGDGVVGLPWMANFCPPDGTDQARSVAESAILQALTTAPVLQDSRAPDGSPLDILDRYYADLLVTPYGEEATLVAFRGFDNTGEIVGTIRTSIVPEPTSWVMMASAAGMIIGSVRRRE